MFPTSIIAAEKKSTTLVTDNKEVPAEVEMLARLDEIKAMDKSSMVHKRKKRTS
jgi:hypothetical protein